MKILLTGASGFIGTNLTHVLTGLGHTVVPVSRRNGMNVSAMTSVKDWLPHLDGVDAVINAIGIIGESGQQRFDTLHREAPIALFQACAASGVRRVIQISALGADDGARSRYHLTKLAADNALRSLDLDWFVLRPSLVYGRGGTSTEMFMQMARLPVFLLVGNGVQLIQPVHVCDLVDIVVHCLGTSAVRQTLDVVGPETINFRTWMQRMRAAQGKGAAKTIGIPDAVIRMACTVLGGISPMMSMENIEMLNRSCVSDPAPLVTLLGKPLRQNSPTLFFSDTF